MEFGTNNRIKVAWICHFSDENLQDFLPLWRRTPYFGAWIRNTLEGFMNDATFEIHVIAPHQYLKRNVSFEQDGIFFHFFKVGMPIVNRSWPRFFNVDLHTNYFANTKQILTLIHKIKPKLINLHGAENAYYGSSVLKLYKEYPVLVTIQGFVSLEKFVQKDAIVLNRIKVERQIIRCCSYFGGDVDSRQEIDKIKNSEFEYFQYLYPLGSDIKKYMNLKSSKKFDVLFWSRVCKDKGAEDFIVLVSLLKKTNPKITANIIGGVSEQYYAELKTLANELNCLNNITFTGYVKSANDLYLEVLKCKILILPTYNDRLPTVLREALYLKLPVISYKTGSIPELNKNEEVILLKNQGDIEGIKNAAEKLLNDCSFFDDTAERAYQFGIKEFGINYNCKKIKTAYNKILKTTKI